MVFANIWYSEKKKEGITHITNNKVNVFFSRQGKYEYSSVHPMDLKPQRA